MIPFLRDNSVVFLGLLSWFIAQLIKFIIEVSTHRRINWRRFFESGGMPSSHSAFVCSIAMGIGFREGFASSFFALAFMIAMVVMYDAMGVRRAAGEQAEAINELREKGIDVRIDHRSYERQGVELLLILKRKKDLWISSRSLWMICKQMICNR